MMTFLTVVALVVVAIIIFSKIKNLENQILILRGLVFEQKKYIDELYEYINKHLRAAKGVPLDSAEQTTIQDPSETAHPLVSPTAHTEMPTSPIEPPATTAAAPQSTEPQVEYEASAAPAQANEQITYSPPTIPSIPKRKPLIKNEDWVGINLLNRLGALLIIIGAIATAAFEGFHPILRTSILFVAAVAVILLGELLSRKKPTIFSLGVSATGIALLYVAIAASHFELQTLNMYAALIACILATALGVFLATRYNAQVIGIFALVGGYLPIFALNTENYPVLVGLVIYFVLLSLFSLILALTRKWTVMNLIGLGLTIIGTIYIGLIVQADALTALLYACFAFLIYSALPLISAYRTKEKFSELDVWLIIINTFISSLIIFMIANRLNIQNLHAYLCLIFAAVYAGAALLIKRKINHKNMQTIFTLTSIAFGVLFVPFFFEQRWFAIAWLVQGVVLLCYGVLRKQKISEYSGLSILGISAIALIVNYSLLFSQFTLNYTFFTVGLLIALGCYMVKNRHKGGNGQAYKIIAFVNLWIYAMYLWTYYAPLDFLLDYRPKSIYNTFTLSGGALITFALAFLYAKIKLWSDNSVKRLALIMYAVGLLFLWIFNSFPYENTLTLIIFNAVLQVTALFVLSEAMNLCSEKAKGNPIKIPILSAYFLLAVTQTMMVQADVAFSSAIISIKYAVAAFAWIIVGFKLKNKPVRKAGLFLSMASVAKLLVIDTWGLSTEMRIVSYVSLGLILMLISFVYQKLSKD